jgi:hypothetical protein
MENSMEVTKEIQKQLPNDPPVPKAMKFPSCKDTCTSMFISALFTATKKQKELGKGIAL